MQTKYLVLGLLRLLDPYVPSGCERAADRGVGLFDREDPLVARRVHGYKGVVSGTAPRTLRRLPAELAYRDDDGASGASRCRCARAAGSATSGQLLVAGVVRVLRGATAGIVRRPKMLPLTTHCRTSLKYEQYVLKEHSRTGSTTS